MVRAILALLALASLVAAASLRSSKFLNPIGYGNVRSYDFARGDSGDTSGWRNCVEVGGNNVEVGVVCEGLRQIRVHGGRFVDVNYFCEFRFSPTNNTAFNLEYELCQ